MDTIVTQIIENWKNMSSEDFDEFMQNQQRTLLREEMEQIMDAFDEGQEYEYQYHINNAPKFYSETYYQETFGSKGSDATSSQTTSDKWKEYQDWLNKPPEISDEEIEKAAWENPCLSRQDVYELFDEVFKDKTLEGMFKISASKEIRQFKERLRELAKQKYREQLKQK
jgi:hypothetical protein